MLAARISDIASRDRYIIIWTHNTSVTIHLVAAIDLVSLKTV